MKLSAAMCVTIVILPLVRILKEAPKCSGRIIGFVTLGLVCFAFYPIRNVILTGWLFYPFESIDIFNVEWKVPVQYSLIDSTQIKVWGRGLYDVDKIEMPMSEWLPIWWEIQEHYDQMLIYGLFIAAAAIVLTILVNKRIPRAIITFYVMVTANLAIWLISAPFVRYGLIFILTVPLTAAAGLYDAVSDRISQYNRSHGHEIGPSGGSGASLRFMRYVAVAFCVLTAICYAARVDHYMMEDLVFIKHNLSKPYYITQQPFDNPEMGTEYLGEARIPVHYTVIDEINSYYTPISTCYQWMLERCEPIGDSIKDGFKAK